MPGQHLGLRQHGAKMMDLVALCQQQSGKGFNVDVAHGFRLVFYIDPIEIQFRKTLGQIFEVGFVAFANATPTGSQADDRPSLVQRLIEVLLSSNLRRIRAHGGPS